MRSLRRFGGPVLASLTLGCSPGPLDGPAAGERGRAVSMAATGGKPAASASPLAGATPRPAGTPTPTASPTAVASPTPAATATPAGPTPTPIAPGTNPFGLPKPLALPLPTGLAALGFAGLIGNNGGAIVSNNGGSLVPLTKLITDHGAGVVSTGGGAYHLAQATASPTASATPTAGPLATPSPRASMGEAAAALLTTSLQALIVQAKGANAMLALAALTGLEPGKPRTISQASGQPRTLLLSVHPTHATLTVFEAATADPAKRIVAISYTKPTRVRLAVDSLAARPGEPRRRWLEEYDLEAGIVVADGVEETAPDALGRVTTAVTRFELAPPGKGEPAGTAYTFRHTSWTLRTGDTQSPYRLRFTTNFDAAGRAASWYKTGFKSTSGEPPLTTIDGSPSEGAPAGSYGFYMSPDGKNLPADAAPAELKAVLPALDAAGPPFPPDPTLADPYKRTDLDFLD